MYDTARRESLSSSVVRASDRAPKAMGSILVRDLDFFRFPMLLTWWGRGGGAVGARWCSG